MGFIDEAKYNSAIDAEWVDGRFLVGFERTSIPNKYWVKARWETIELGVREFRLRKKGFDEVIIKPKVSNTGDGARIAGFQALTDGRIVIHCEKWERGAWEGDVEVIIDIANPSASDYVDVYVVKKL